MLDRATRSGPSARRTPRSTHFSRPPGTPGGRLRALPRLANRERVPAVLIGAMTVHARARTSNRGLRAHSTTNQGAPAGARPLEQRAHRLEAVMIAGLAGVFLVNAIVAVVEPADFTGLLERSLIGRAIPAMSGEWVAWAIAVHDLTIGVLLLVTMSMARLRPLVLAWAGAWLLAVTVVKLTALEALGG